MAEETVFVIEGDRNLLERLRRSKLEVRHLLKDALDDISLRAEAVARERAPFRTGNLVRNIRRDKADHVGPDTLEGAIGVSRQAPYALWVHDGTGIFGETGNLIRPRVKRVMVFEKEGKVFFRSYVKGQKPQPFMAEAFESVANTYVPLRVGRLRQQIGNLGGLSEDVPNEGG